MLNQSINQSTCFELLPPFYVVYVILSWLFTIIIVIIIDLIVSGFLTLVRRLLKSLVRFLAPV